MLCLKYQYWLKLLTIDHADDKYELVKRHKEFRTMNDAIDHSDLLKKTWGRHLVSVKLEFNLYQATYDLSRNINESAKS